MIEGRALREAPLAESWLDGAPAEQHGVASHHQRGDDNLRVLVVDEAAGRAHVARALVARRRRLGKRHRATRLLGSGGANGGCSSGGAAGGALAARLHGAARASQR